MIKKVKELTGFHYLLTKIQLYTLIIFELNICEINQLLKMYVEDKIMYLLCVDFIAWLS